jgi:hypothetical protein
VITLAKAMSRRNISGMRLFAAVSLVSTLMVSPAALAEPEQIRLSYDT